MSVTKGDYILLYKYKWEVSATAILFHFYVQENNFYFEVMPVSVAPLGVFLLVWFSVS